jgi:CTD small phosphatase-like protein 2
LKELSQYFQLVLFTASEQSYADAILNLLDPYEELFDMRLYRQHCIPTTIACGGSSYLKDVRIIANREMKDLVIVDNAVFCFSLQLDNGIPILPFHHDAKDDELLHLVYYLKNISEVDDVREHNR